MVSMQKSPSEQLAATDSPAAAAAAANSGTVGCRMGVDGYPQLSKASL